MDLNCNDIIEKQTVKRKQTEYCGARCVSGGRPYTGACVIDRLPSNESGKSKPNYVKNKQNMALMQISLYCTATKDCFVGMKKRISYTTRYQVTDGTKNGSSSLWP